MHPKFSILMTNYNKGEFIKESINSVFAQSYDNWELLIIDDASADNSVSIIDSFKDNRKRLIRNELKKGTIDSLRTILEMALGEVMVILDADDAVDKRALEKINKIYSENLNVGLVYTQCWYCDEKLDPIHLGYSKKIPKRKTNLHQNSIVALRTFKKDAYYKTQGLDDDCVFAEDIDLMLKLEEVTKVYFLNEPLYFYRVLQQSQTHGFRNEMINRSSTALAKYNAYLRRKKTGFKNINQVQAFEIMIWGIVSSLLSKQWIQANFFLKEIVKNFYIFFWPTLYFLLLLKMYKIFKIKRKKI